MFDHKFLNTSGFPTFWNGIKDAVKFEEDHLDVPESTNSVEDPVLQYKTPINRCTCTNVSQIMKITKIFSAKLILDIYMRMVQTH
jgi:hypothetical protein